MKNRWTKIAVIIASILAVLLLTAFVLVVVRGGELAGIFDLNKIFHRETTQAETSQEATTLEPMTETPETSETPESSEEVPSTEGSTEPTPEQLQKTLNIGVGELQGQYVQLYATADGDKVVNKLTQVNLLTLDRSGNILYHSGNLEKAVYNGTEYAYHGIADIDVEYDKESDITTYTIKLRKGLAFSDGTPLTADDLVFNYYVRLEPDYAGEGKLRQYNIVGLQNYYYNNSMAEDQNVTAKEVDAELESPGEAVSAYIRNLILETLQAEAKQSEALWKTYQSYGYGNSAQEFFYKIYGLDLNYNLLDKDMDTVCREVAESYGLDYRKLAENYAVDETYFDDQIRGYVRETLLLQKIQASDGEPVDYISGIIRLGDNMLKLKVYGNDEKAAYDLLDIDVLPLHYYGDLSLYNYNAHQFGFVPGEFSIPEEKLAAPFGAGPYVFAYGSDDSVTFTRNDLYYQGEAGAEYVNVRCHFGEGLGYVSEGVIDVAEIPGNKTNYDTICKQNANKEIVGDALVAHEVNVLGYAYIGINANNVNVGGDPDSEASKNLRKGLATALSAFRDVAYNEYFGNSIGLIDYPVSDFYGIAPAKNEPTYKTAYSTTVKGKEIYSKDLDITDRFYKVVDAVRDYFKKAGYTFDKSGKLKAAPDGGAVLFGVSICSDEYSFTVFPSYEVLTYAKSVLFEIGISLDIRYIPNEESMLVALYTGTCDLWCASWFTGVDPEFAEHYQGTGRTEGMVPNIYGISDKKIDKLLLQIQEESDPAAKLKLQRSLMELVREWAVEIPCYQLNNYYVYNANTLKVDSIPKDLTVYHSWLDEIINLEVGDRE